MFHRSMKKTMEGKRIMEENKKVCPYCGEEVSAENSVCSSCGGYVKSVEKASEPTIESQASAPSYQNDAPGSGTSLQALGTLLMVIGGLCDVMCMFMISSGSYESFSTLTTFGTIAFIVGLFMRFNG